MKCIGWTQSVAALVCLICAANPARADQFTDMSVFANPGAQQVFQGADGTVTFRVFGLTGTSVVLDSLDPFYVYGGMIDQEDEITKIARTGGTCGIGSIVSGLVSCTYVIGFVTDDPRRPLDPNTDYGLWNIDLDVTAHGLLDLTQQYTANGVAEVDVLDPGYVSTPEPGTIVMVAIAMLFLLALKSLRHLPNIYKQT